MTSSIATCLACALLFAMPEAQAQPSRPAFEVASVKAASGADYHDWIRPVVVDSQRFRARIRLEQLLEWAYSMREFQLLQIPDWVQHEFFEIEATASHPSTEPEFRQMLQVLLEDRFRLKIRRDTRDFPLYVLTIGKNGSKLIQSSKVKSGAGQINIGGGRLIAKGTSVGAFCGILSDNLDRPVIDRTNLTGNYDFELNFDPPEGPVWKPIGPPLFTIVQDLGLKLESQKLATDVTIIESIEHPSAN